MWTAPGSVLVTLTGALVGAGDPTPAPASTWVLGTRAPVAAASAPGYVGNGYLGTRVPAAGAGFVASPVATETHVAGVYADIVDLRHGTAQPQGAVNLPAWSTLDFSDGSGTYDLATGVIKAYRQEFDTRADTVTTTVTWASPAGRVTDLRLVVLLDRARSRVGAVRLQVRPRWSGAARVTDVLGEGFDYHPPNVSAGLERGVERVDAGSGAATLTARTRGTGITIAYAGRLRAPRGARIEGGTAATTTQLTATFRVRAGRWYAVEKLVGVATSQDAADPVSEARRAVTSAGRFGAVMAENAAAWRRLWRADILVPGDDALQRDLRAAQAYLLASSPEPGTPGAGWSLSPVGLSGSGYNNHVFWDAETWMYPALLAQRPKLARSVVDYRYRTRDGARANAKAGGYAGSRYPWESALDGREVTPTWAETGRYEQHITADVALAQWQYYLATGDRGWLAERGWPVLRGAADFWVSRATANPDRTWSILGVQGPDESHYPVDDEVYTNVAAKTALRIAGQAAAELGEPADPRWDEVADGLVVLPPGPDGARPQFRGYAGDQVKQADVVMLTYPWEYPQPASVDRANLEYYAQRYDPDGPAMTDSVNAIVAAAQDATVCDAWGYTQRSRAPFTRPPYQQFTESRAGRGVFTFLTGEGGLLQEFLYGYSGLRWRADHLALSPTLPPELAGGLTLTGLRWRGRVFDVDIRTIGTTVTLRAGAPLPIRSGAISAEARVAAPARIDTRVPRCA